MKLNFVFKFLSDEYDKQPPAGSSINKYNLVKHLDVQSQIQNNSVNLNYPSSITNSPLCLSSSELSNQNRSNSSSITLECCYYSNDENSEAMEKYHQGGILLKNSCRIVDIKLFLSVQYNFKIDSIELFTYSSNLSKINKISDDEFITKFVNSNSLLLKPQKILDDSNFSCLNSGYNSTKNSMSNVNLPNLIYFYFKLNEKQIKVNLEYHLNSIDNIIYQLSTSCQIYMLKYLLNKKFNEFPINEQILTFLGMSQSEEESENNNNKDEDTLHIQNLNTLEINDKMSLEDLIKSYQPYNSHKYLNLLLAHKGKKKCSIGLDFSFALLKNLKKIEFDNFAPSYREACDGINIFCYCNNLKCILYEQMFINCLGFGKFDIIREIEGLTCPSCKSIEFIQARNIGFIHCEWSYRGILFNKNNSIIAGDGFTVDDKIYVMNEIDLIKNIDRLDICVKEILHKYIEEKNQSCKDIDSSFDDEDIQFSVRRKDLFKDAPDSSNNKIFENFHKNRDIKKANIQINISNNNVNLEPNSHVDTYNNLQNSKNCKVKSNSFEIKLDNKKQVVCCNSYLKNETNGKFCLLN